MPFVDEILEGRIIDQYREIAEATPDLQTSDVPPCSFPAVCSEAGCRQSDGGSADCCTDDKKEKKKDYDRAAAWFDPPVAHRQ